MAPVRKQISLPERTASMFYEVPIIMSIPVSAAADASSAEFAVTWVNFLFPLPARRSATVKLHLDGLPAAHV